MPFFYFKRKRIGIPFINLSDKHRTIVILWMAGYTYREITGLGLGSSKTIRKALESASEENYIKKHESS